jgi:hypothetical protein
MEPRVPNTAGKLVSCFTTGALREGISCTGIVLTLYLPMFSNEQNEEPIQHNQTLCRGSKSQSSDY